MVVVLVIWLDIVSLSVINCLFVGLFNGLYFIV